MIYSPRFGRANAAPNNTRPAGTHGNADDVGLALSRSIVRTQSFLRHQGTFVRFHEAIDAGGKPCDPVSPLAVDYCTNGAYLQVNRPTRRLYRCWLNAANSAAQRMTGDSATDLFSFNDHDALDVHDLMMLLDSALRLVDED